MLGYLRTNICLKKALLRVLVDLDMEHQHEGRSAGSREPTTGESSGSQKEMTTRGTPGRGAQESEDAGMGQMSWRLREAREEGDPGMQRQAVRRAAISGCLPCESAPCTTASARWQTERA